VELSRFYHTSSITAAELPPQDEQVLVLLGGGFGGFAPSSISN
jgi:hypothetical protein